MPAVLFLIFGILCGVSLSQVSPTRKYWMYVGTYTKNGSEGIYAYHFDADSGRLVPIGLAAKTVDPSFLTITPDNRFLYAVNEVDRYNGQPTGSLSAFAIDRAAGKLSALNQVSARDPGPAYVAMDKTGKYALIANYSLGSVAVFPVLSDGKLGEASDFVRHQGSGLDKERQAGPHGHAIQVSPDNRFAIAADLGLDELIVYPFDATQGKLGHPHVTKIKAGSGPRHFVFSPSGRFVYLINEMAGTITGLSYHAADGALKELQTVSTLPNGFKGENSTAEIVIHPSGKFVYGSNRGDDSIVFFSVDHATGKLTFVERVSTGGKEPRNFALDPTGRWLFAANQNSNNIVSFKVDQKTGRLNPTGQTFEISQPVCVVFVPAD